MSITSHGTLTFGFRASLNSELDVQFLLGYYFKVFSRPNFLTFQHFLTHLEIHDNFVCVCVEMLFLKNFTIDVVGSETWFKK